MSDRRNENSTFVKCNMYIVGLNIFFKMALGSYKLCPKKLLFIQRTSLNHFVKLITHIIAVVLNRGAANFRV